MEFEGLTVKVLRSRNIMSQLIRRIISTINSSIAAHSICIVS